ncbi:MAG: PASTA domain-containing protein [Paludibacteraceae bacterium]|nr:PASTA domain-containing protein [Paludibacteraceae bacterium]
MSFKKETWGATFKHWLLHPIIISFFLAIAIFIGLLFGLSKWLDKYTDHGHEVELTKLAGMKVEEAEATLQAQGLYGTVIDSMYSTSVAPGCVIDQVPSAGSKVKEGRQIYLYIRARNARQVTVPEFKDKSLRQFQGELESAGLKVKDVRFVPSKFNTVIGVEYNGVAIPAGKRLTEGSQVVIKAGKGDTNDFSEMPSVLGMGVVDATNRVQAMALNVNVVFDVTPSSEANKRFYKVYAQKPEAQAKIAGNETVTLYATTTQSKLP